MTDARIQVRVGTRFNWDDELLEIVRLPGIDGLTEVVARDLRQERVCRMSLEEVVYSPRCRLLNDDLNPYERGVADPVSLRWNAAPESVRRLARMKAAHIRETLTGYQSGNADTARKGEPRAAYRPSLPKGQRIAAKAQELHIGQRTLERWIQLYLEYGEPGLISKRDVAPGLGSRQDPRWRATAEEVMGERIEMSKPTKTLVIAHTDARLVMRHGVDGIRLPSRPTANRILQDIDKTTTPLFEGSAKRVRDIAGRPQGVYGKLLPTRPGEFMLMDTTRLDAYAMDSQTLKWVGLDLTLAMDWYSRCIVGLRLTPTTRSIDAAAVLYECFRPKAAGSDWPRAGLWPAHGIPRHMLVELEHLDPASVCAATPAIVPDALVIDHAKILVGEHVHGVCQQAGISIEPARLREGRDKGPVERVFKTIRQGFLQELPGYKGPDVYSRGVNPEKDAFFFINEMEALLREWIAVVYHHTPHEGVGEPGLWSLEMTPAQMFEHGVARAGYIEAPRDPSLSYQFLRVDWRTRQPAGFDIKGRMYSGDVLDGYAPGEKSPYKHRKGLWPIHIDPDDIRTAYFFDLKNTHQWQPLTWNLAKALDLPMAEDGWKFARAMILSENRKPDDELALAALLERRKLSQGVTPAELRAALRLSREQSSLAADLEKADLARKLLNSRTQRPALPPAYDSAEAFVDDLDEQEEQFDDDAFDDHDPGDIKPLEDL